MFVLVVTDACRGTIGRGGLVAVVLYLCRALIAVLLRRYICGIFSCPIKATATIALRFQDTREKRGGGKGGEGGEENVRANVCIYTEVCNC